MPVLESLNYLQMSEGWGVADWNLHPKQSKLFELLILE